MMDGFEELILVQKFQHPVARPTITCLSTLHAMKFKYS